MRLGVPFIPAEFLPILLTFFPSRRPTRVVSTQSKLNEGELTSQVTDSSGL